MKDMLSIKEDMISIHRYCTNEQKYVVVIIKKLNLCFFEILHSNILMWKRKTTFSWSMVQARHLSKIFKFKRFGQYEKNTTFYILIDERLYHFCMQSKGSKSARFTLEKWRQRNQKIDINIAITLNLTEQPLLFYSEGVLIQMPRQLRQKHWPM